MLKYAASSSELPEADHDPRDPSPQKSAERIASQILSYYRNSDRKPRQAPSRRPIWDAPAPEDTNDVGPVDRDRRSIRPSFFQPRLSAPPDDGWYRDNRGRGPSFLTLLLTACLIAVVGGGVTAIAFKDRLNPPAQTTQTAASSQGTAPLQQTDAPVSAEQSTATGLASVSSSALEAAKGKIRSALSATGQSREIVVPAPISETASQAKPALRAQPVRSATEPVARRMALAEERAPRDRIMEVLSAQTSTSAAPSLPETATVSGRSFAARPSIDEPASVPIAETPTEAIESQATKAAPVEDAAPEAARQVVARAPEPQTEVRPSPANSSFEDNGTVTISVNMRSGPTNGSQIVGVVPAGSNISIASCDPWWCQVSHDGDSGYIAAKFVSR